MEAASRVVEARESRVAFVVDRVRDWDTASLSLRDMLATAREPMGVGKTSDGDGVVRRVLEMVVVRSQGDV